MKSKVVFILCAGMLAAIPTSRVAGAGQQDKMETPAQSTAPPTQTPAPGHQHYSTAEAKAWGILFQIMERLEELVSSKSLGSIHDDDILLNSAVRTLMTESEKNSASRTNQTSSGLLALTRQVAALHTAGDAFDQAGCEAALKSVRSAFVDAQKPYNAELLEAGRALAERYCCPMHPDVTGTRMSPCPKCGMPLDAQVRLSSLAWPVAAGTTTILRATVQTDAPLQTGVKTNGRLHLTTAAGQPVAFDQLREVHTKRIHLLLVDGSLTDYHHEHPVPTGIAGEYAFSFTPTKPGPYGVWADVQPYSTGLQEYVMTTIPADKPGEPLTDKVERLKFSQGEFGYAIEFNQKVKAGTPVLGRLRVTKGDGSGFIYLEPIMGAFAHLVAFHEDGTTVVHTHSKETRQLGPEDRGGPDFEFQFFPPKPGFYRLFVQVQFNRIQQFASFGINVN